MGKINVLDMSVANLIAAGEVVERPASAIKELLENSIDAGASSITAEIKNGGVSLMRITDNGCGMSRDDATVCIKRHATSKIKNSDDLDGIMTLGFRGEALAAISSVSRMRIMTRTADSDVGTLIECNCGEIVSVEDTGCPFGTTVIVEELFANVPARRKFLRRDVTETAAISAVIEKIALSNPTVSIKFIADGNVKFQTSGDGNLMNVIYSVLGREFAKKMAEIHDMTDGIEVTGYIGTPENCRGNRNYENFFINGRYVKCQTASAALEQAFSSYIPSDKFPCCVICITVNPAFVDVNVHPQKMEVKFSSEKPVFDAVYCAVRNALMNRINRPAADEIRTRYTGDSFRLYNDIMSMKADSDAEALRIASEKDSLQARYEQIIIPKAVNDTGFQKNESDHPAVYKTDTAESDESKKPIPEVSCVTENKITDTVKDVKELKPAKDIAYGMENVKKMEQHEDEQTTVPDFRIVGVIFECYVFVELTDKIIIIDKHAAHERIIFEKLKTNLYSNNPNASQLLLIPIEVTINPTEYAALCEYRAELSRIGFDFSPSGKKNITYIIQYPFGLTHVQAQEMFYELAAGLSDGKENVSENRNIICEKALYQASCKAAVKGGKVDSPENIEWIVKHVLARNDIRYCPHGRPVAFEMTKSQFEKMFERT